MYVIVHEYEIDPRLRDAFEREYGSHGGWAAMFAQTAGFRGTRLLRDVEGEGSRYVVLDRWDDETSFRQFMQEHAGAYEARNPVTRDLYTREVRLGAMHVPDA
jgi:heme-degrading monooxygenase HmoA